jgi:dihydrofolate reductase
MRKLTVFNNVSLDGYFVDQHGDMSWAHNDDAEWRDFTAENAGGGGQLVFGRVTYDLMASFWPTPAALAQMPAVAERMNALPKLVCSRTLETPAWNNTTVVKGDLAAEFSRLKGEPGPDMVIMGSGSIVAQLAQAGLIDEYQLIVHPLILGAGRTLFAGVSGRPALRRTGTRSFANGNVLLCYGPPA